MKIHDNIKRGKEYKFRSVLRLQHVRKELLVAFPTAIIIPNKNMVPCRYPPSSQDRMFREV